MTTPSGSPDAPLSQTDEGGVPSRERNRRPKDRSAMGFSVNLLPKADERSRRRRTAVRVVQALLLLLLIAVVAAIAMLWWVTALQNREVASQEQRISALQSRISTRSGAEQRYHLAVNRATLAKKILSEQARFDRTLAQLFGILPQGVDVVSASLTDSISTIGVSVETASLSVLQELLAAVRADPLLSTVVTKQHRTARGTYELYFNLTFQ